MRNRFAILFGLVFVCTNALAEEQIKAEVLSQSPVSWDGSAFQYLKETPEITIVKIKIVRDAKIPIHCHPIPLAAYVAKGAIEVLKPSGEKRIFKEGEAFIEVVNTWHKGLGVGNETELIVFYAGNKKIPLSVGKTDDEIYAGKCK